MPKPPFFCASPRSVQTLNARAAAAASKQSTSPEREARSKAETMSRVKKVITSPLSRRRQGGGAKRVFGVPLDEVMRDAAPGDVVPKVVVKICEFIEREGMDLEGVFRVSGNQKIVEKLKSEFETRGDADLKAAHDVAAVASVLKHFLRELPVALIPNEMKPQFLAAYAKNQDNQDMCAKELATLVTHLPAAHFQLLKYVVNFLVNVSLNEPQNKMGTVALAIVFGPNIFKLSDGLKALKEQQFTNGVVAILLQHYDVIFKGLNEGSPKSKGKAPPAKPLPFREHTKAKKQRRLTHYGDMDEEDGCRGDMTVIGDTRGNCTIMEEVTDKLAQTIDEKDLLSARQRRRISASHRPLPDPPRESVTSRFTVHHQYEEVELKDDEIADDKELVTVTSAVLNKTKKPQLQVKVVDVAPSSHSSIDACQSSRLEDTSVGLTESNVRYFNTLNNCNGIVDEDQMRSASPWSVSSEAASPVPVASHSQQLGAVVHATVTRHLLGPFVHKATEYSTGCCNGEVQLESAGVETSALKDEGATNSQQQDVRSHVADWEERIIRSKGLSLPSDVAPDDATRKDVRRKKPESKAFELFEKSGELLQFRSPPDSTRESVSLQDKSSALTKNNKPAVPARPSRLQKDLISTEIPRVADCSEEFDSVRRHFATGMLTSLTSSRAPPPRNRRQPSHVVKQTDEVVVTDFDEGHSPVFSDTHHPPVVPPLDLAKLVKTSEKKRRSNTKVTAWSSDDHEEPLEEKAREDTVQAEVHAFCPSPEVARSNFERTDGGKQTSDTCEVVNTGERVDSKTGDPNNLEETGDRHISDVTTANAEERSSTSPERNSMRHLEGESTDEDRTISSLFEGLSLKALTKAYRVRRQRIQAHQAEFEKVHGRKPDKREYGPIQDVQREYHVLRRLVKAAKLVDGHEGKTDDKVTNLDTVGEEPVRRSQAVPVRSPPPQEIDMAESIDDTMSLSVSPELVSQLNSDEKNRLSVFAVAMKKTDADMKRKRGLQSRPDDLKSMTLAQLREEKQSVQRALLSLEKLHGRPRNQAEKDLTRPIYNRYRMVKQILSDWEQSEMPASSTMTAAQMADEKRKVTERHTSTVQELKGRTSPKELADSGIQIDRRSSSERGLSRRSDEMPSASSVEAAVLVDSVGSSHSDVFPSVVSGRSESSPVEMLTCLSTEELQQQLKKKTATKKELRIALKNFESEFEQKHGRKVGKGDRSVMAAEYEQYKKVKSSMKHIERLLSEKGVTGTLTV